MAERLQRLLGSQLGVNLGGTPADSPQVDTAEQVYISSLALLKMLKHGRAGVPMEVNAPTHDHCDPGTRSPIDHSLPDHRWPPFPRAREKNTSTRAHQRERERGKRK